MIRKFERGDLEEILKIEREAFPKSAYSALTFLYYAENYPDSFLVYENEEGKVIGYIIFYPNGHIVSIAVSRSYRRRGIGTRLIEEVLKVTGGRARVEVRRSNEGAIKFYKKLGFSLRYIIEAYYGDEDALVMTIGGEDGFREEI
ncbi:MAG: ribosomal protein S18-alanine N-acetyltransferase [Candidatus Methanospirareceae archaeon]